MSGHADFLGGWRKAGNEPSNGAVLAGVDRDDPEKGEQED